MHIPSDVDECSLLNGGCHQICTNTIGGFDCSCNEGYTINTDNRTCQGTIMHYYTINLLPLVLNFSKFISFFTSSTVDPVAMCDASNSCAQSCVRLSGMETCGCLPGYELASNGMNCTSTLKHSNNSLCIV